MPDVARRWQGEILAQRGAFRLRGEIGPIRLIRPIDGARARSQPRPGPPSTPHPPRYEKIPLRV